jgi:hypothetical protein
MSRCPYCRSQLPGLQTMCETCWEKNSANPASTRPWLPKGLPRLTRGNVLGFLFLFVIGFLTWRFDFPYLHHRHFRTNEWSAFMALLLASVAVYMNGER